MLAACCRCSASPAICFSFAHTESIVCKHCWALCFPVLQPVVGCDCLSPLIRWWCQCNDLLLVARVSYGFASPRIWVLLLGSSSLVPCSVGALWTRSLILLNQWWHIPAWSFPLHCLHDASLFRSLKHWVNQKLSFFFFPVPSLNLGIRHSQQIWAGCCSSHAVLWWGDHSHVFSPMCPEEWGVTGGWCRSSCWRTAFRVSEITLVCCPQAFSFLWCPVSQSIQCTEGCGIHPCDSTLRCAPFTCPFHHLPYFSLCRWEVQAIFLA